MDNFPYNPQEEGFGWMIFGLNHEDRRMDVRLITSWALNPKIVLVKNSMQQNKEIGRLFQDTQFEVTHLQECTVEQLIGIIDSEVADELQPTLLLLKPTNRLWQRFFLDVGAGFWEQWLNTDVENELADNGWKHVDYAERFALRGAEIQEIICEPAGENMNSFIMLRLSCGTLLLEAQNAHDIESNSVISFLR